MGISNCKRVVIHLGRDISNEVIAFEIKPPKNDASGFIHSADIALRMRDGTILYTDTLKTEITIIKE